MKKAIILLVIVNCQLSIVNSYSQTLSPTAMPTSGGYYSAGGNSLSWTEGETYYTTLTGTGTILTQGEQQPEVNVGGCTSAPATPGAISGPSVVCNITTAVYSIAAVPGATTYTWTVPTGATGMTIISGQGTTAIAVTISPGTVIGNVTVTATNACGTSTAGILYVTKKPQAPGAIAGPASACGLTTATYSIAPVFGATSYSWTVPAGITITSGTGTTGITVNIATSFVSGTISVSGVNACGSVAGTAIFVTAHTPAAPVLITGATTVCGMTTATYTTSGTAGAISYLWTVPAWLTISSGQGTTAINVTASGTPAAGTISVAGIDACGTGTARVLNLVTTSPVPSSISGPANICGMTSASYTTPSLGTGYVYNWSLSAVTGWSIASGQGTTAITITGPSAGTTTSGLVKLTATNSCGNTSGYKSIPLTSCHSPLVNNNGAGQEQNSFSELYPNPTSTGFKVDVITDVEQEITIQVYDVLGNLIISGKHRLTSGENTLITDIETYKNGMYFVRLVDKDANTVYSGTVVKQ